MQMNLTASELIEIIKECKHSVSVLKLTKSSIEVVFSSKPLETISSAVTTPNLTENKSDGEIKYTEVTFTPETSSLIDEEQELIEDLKVSDPLAYEELLASKELVNVEENR